MREEMSGEGPWRLATLEASTCGSVLQCCIGGQMINIQLYRWEADDDVEVSYELMCFGKVLNIASVPTDVALDVTLDVSPENLPEEFGPGKHVFRFDNLDCVGADIPRTMTGL